MSQPLLAHLLREYDAITIFLELLEQEAEALSTGGFAKLTGLAERKSVLADEIVMMRDQREAVQQKLGYAAGRSGADAVAVAGGEAAQDAWNALLKRAAQAHAANHRNGVMVHTHLDFTRESLNFLKASGLPLYGPDGNHNAGTGGGTHLGLG
jgi:flagella synthesis protein FlgN